MSGNNNSIQSVCPINTPLINHSIEFSTSFSYEDYSIKSSKALLWGSNLLSLCVHCVITNCKKLKSVRFKWPLMAERPYRILCNLVDWFKN